jgi:hypothetical protein
MGNFAVRLRLSRDAIEPMEIKAMCNEMQKHVK